VSRKQFLFSVDADWVSSRHRAGRDRVAFRIADSGSSFSRLPVHGCINVHSAPLPSYRGMLPSADDVRRFRAAGKRLF
jgi:hypothetical protein